MKLMLNAENYCTCGIVSAKPKAKPLERFACHCETCRQHTGQAFSDECLFWFDDVKGAEEDELLFEKQSKFTPLSRGVCRACGKPAISVLSVTSSLKFVLLPSVLLTASDELPPLSAHVFYHRCVSEIQDNVPKYRGYLASQLATQWHILKACLKSKFHYHR